MTKISTWFFSHKLSHFHIKLFVYEYRDAQKESDRFSFGFGVSHNSSNWIWKT